MLIPSIPTATIYRESLACIKNDSTCPATLEVSFNEDEYIYNEKNNILYENIDVRFAIELSLQTQTEPSHLNYEIERYSCTCTS